MSKKVSKAVPIFIISMFLWLILGSTITVSADWQKEIDGSYCYITDSGEKATGFQKIGDATYYFDKSGKMRTSKWLTTSSGAKYYFKKDGSMAVGKVKIGKNTYYFGKNGKMWTSKWLTTSSGVKYYFQKDGTMAVGKVKIGGKTYEFDSNGKLLVSELWKPYEGVKWNMTQSEVIKSLNLKEDDYYEIDDDIMLTINEVEDISSAFLCDIYIFDDKKLIAIGSCGLYSKGNLKFLKDEFESEGFIFVTSQEIDDGTYCYYLSKNNIGGIVYSEDFIAYFITSDSFSNDMLN